jgi:cytochrome c oxidase subunit IV
MEDQATAHHEEHPPTTIRQYVLIGVVLAVITGIELWLSYSPLARGVMITALLLLSAVKFAIVVALFMHLKFDSKYFTRMFVIGLVLAGTLLVALISLFWNDSTNIIGTYANVPAAAAGGHGEGGGEATGGGSAEPGDTVKDMPVAEYFAANCAVCHGQNREGIVGPALTPAVLTQPDDFYFETIKNGRPGTAMPSWGAAGLSDDDIHALVHFVKTVEP